MQNSQDIDSLVEDLGKQGVTVDIIHRELFSYSARIDFTNATFAWNGALTLINNRLNEDKLFGLLLGILYCAGRDSWMDQ